MKGSSNAASRSGITVLRKHGYGFRQQRRITNGQDLIAANATKGFAAPSGNAATCTLDYRNQGGPVPNLHVGFGDYVYFPEREQAIRIAVTPPGYPPHG